MAPFLFGSPIIRKLLMSLELQILKLVKAIFLTTILKTTLFIQSYGQFGAVNTEILMRNERDYFKISTTISPSIQDLIDKGYIGANEDGKVIDLRDNKSILNELKIKLIYDADSGKILAQLA